MADSSQRPAGGSGRRGIFRRAPREAVPAIGSRDFDPRFGDGGDGGGGEGSAGVREPRRPLPLGPRSDAAALPTPQSFTAITLPDPRR